MLYSELAREKMWARIHLMPVLQAEADRDMVRRYYAEKAREKELLGKEIKVYNSDRYAVHRLNSLQDANSVQVHPADLCGYPVNRLPRLGEMKKCFRRSMERYGLGVHRLETRRTAASREEATMRIKINRLCGLAVNHLNAETTCGEQALNLC